MPGQIACEIADGILTITLDRPEMLNAETVARIMQAVEQLGYTPKHSARALSTGRHGNVALVVPDVANPFFPPMIRAVQNEADRQDYCVFLGNSDEDPRQEEKLLGRFSGQVEGIVLASPRMSDEKIRAFAAVKPLVVINRDVYSSGTSNQTMYK